MRLLALSFICCCLFTDLTATPAYGDVKVAEGEKFAEVGNNAEDALSQLNAIRNAAQLPPFEYDTHLEKSSQNHANYIAKHAGKSFFGEDLHQQNASRKGFTGVTASDRSAAVKYPSKVVTENISIGSISLSKSMTSLMAAIYHRFTFLDFLSDTVGFGTAIDKSDVNNGVYNYVFNMGRSDLENSCTDQPKKALPIKPMECLGTVVNPDYINNLCQNIPLDARFDEIFPSKCENGRLLKASYMDEVCKFPSEEILQNNAGRYYQICKPKIRVKTEWFDGICHQNNHPALHSGENRYYEICESKTRVFASWFKNFCESATPQDQLLTSSLYVKPCHSDFKMRTDYQKKLDAKQYQKSPPFIIWPAKNAKNVSPVFYDEIPDPLPDLDVSGYPLSLQFNPGKINSAKIRQFTLEKKTENGTWKTVKDIRPLNHLNDPHKTFSKLEFAWFPLKRLDWNTHYRASATVLTQNTALKASTQTIKWAFKTEKTEAPLIIVNAQQQHINVPQNEWFTLYHLPSKSVSRPMKQISAEWRTPANVESVIVDMNTLKMKVGNNGCHPVILNLAQRSKLTLKTCR